MKTHRYTLGLEWTGNRGRGTRDIAAYDRAHRITAPGKPDVAGSSDPSFRGDPTRWNPEELLVASLAACHKFWYLGLCAGAGVDVRDFDEMTALIGAASGGHLEAVSFLLAEGAEPNARDKDLITALMEAAIMGHGDIAEALIAAGAEVDARAASGVSPLWLAAGEGRLAVVSRLAECQRPAECRPSRRPARAGSLAREPAGPAARSHRPQSAAACERS